MEGALPADRGLGQGDYWGSLGAAYRSGSTSAAAGVGSGLRVEWVGR